MDDRLTRWQWARRHTEFSWRETLYSSLVAVIGWALLGQALRPELRLAGAAVLGIAVVYVIEFGWRFARAEILQDRKDLTATRAALIAMTMERDAALSFQPAIDTRLEGDGRYWYIAVDNDGAPGRFEAQIRIHSANHFADATPGSRYPAYWEGGARSEARILTGLRGRIRIGGKGLVLAGPVTGPTLEIYFAGPYEAPGVISQVWPARAKLPTPEPAVWFEVTISSEPPMRGGALVRKYVMTFAGMRESPFPS